MQERRSNTRGRTLFGGKIVFNSGRSAIDCTVRNLSEQGACLQVTTPIGIPDEFYLIVGDAKELQPCRIAWRSPDRVGVEFIHEQSNAGDGATAAPETEKMALQAALDQVQVGIVLLDDQLRAQFINRAFRSMFRLPDAKADSRPPFVALMYHGRDTRAYQIPASQVDHYVAQRVALVKAGDTTPQDIRLSDGEVLRFQCAVLPGGGRMLAYTSVTDIVRHSDELDTLRSALDRIREGVTLLDPNLNVKFMNRAVRRLWHITDEQAESGCNIAELLQTARIADAYAVAPAELQTFLLRRIAQIRAGDPTPIDIATKDGLVLRAQCDPLPSGGRMITYCDVTDLVRKAGTMAAQPRQQVAGTAAG